MCKLKCERFYFSFVLQNCCCDLIVVILVLSIIYSQRHLRRFMRFLPPKIDTLTVALTLIVIHIIFPSSRLEIHWKITIGFVRCIFIPQKSQNAWVDTPYFSINSNTSNYHQFFDTLFLSLSHSRSTSIQTNRPNTARIFVFCSTPSKHSNQCSLLCIVCSVYFGIAKIQ